MMLDQDVELEIQCEWASTLAFSREIKEEEINALIDASLKTIKLFKDRDVKKSISEGRGNLMSNIKRFKENQLTCIIPLCIFLRKAKGKFADIVIPKILYVFESVPEYFNLQPIFPEKYQNAVTKVLISLYKIMHIADLDISHVNSISQVVKTLVQTCLFPKVKITSGPNARYFFVRALARDIELLDSFPLLPQDAADILDLLHDHFYLRDVENSGAQIYVKIETSESIKPHIIPHIDDEKIMALTIPIVTAAFPEKDGTIDNTLLTPPLKIKPEKLYRIVSFACESVQFALQPILETATNGTLKSIAPESRVGASNRKPSTSPVFVHAAAKLATKLIYRLWQHRNSGNEACRNDLELLNEEVFKVADIMLEVAEACIESSHEYGVPHVLSIARLMLKETTQLISGCVGFADSMSDNLSRLRSLILSCVRLVEDQGHYDRDMNSSYGSHISKGSQKSQSSLHSDSDIAWEWDVSVSFISQAEEKEQEVLLLIRVAAEALCATLASAWKEGYHSAVRAIAIPLGNVIVFSAVSSTSGERQIAAMTLGRLFVVVNGDPDMAKLLLPLFVDGMSGSERGTPPQVYACLLHVLATVGGVSGQHGFPWALDQVLEQIIKQYKDPRCSISAELMYANGKEGKQKGAMAKALLQIAKLCQKSNINIRKDIRFKLLALFSDFSLRAYELNAIRDLGELLPAIAASCENLDNSVSRMFSSQSGLRSSRNLELGQTNDVTLMRNFRNLWIYSAIYNFACFSKTNGEVPSWKTALGIIAASTPILISVNTLHETEIVTERLQAELTDRLNRAGPLTEQLQLSNLLKNMVAPYGNTITGNLLAREFYAYLVAVTALELCRAQLAPLPSPDDDPPMDSVMHYMSVTNPGSTESQWFNALSEKVFYIFLNRLTDSDMSDARIPCPNIQKCQVRIAKVLIGGMATQSGYKEGAYPQIAEMSNHLLIQLLRKFPSLYWNRNCLNKLLCSMGDEEKANMILDGRLVMREGLVSNWVKHWVEAIAKIAPTRAEALMHEYLRDESGDESQVVLRHATDLLSICAKVRREKTSIDNDGSQHSLSSLVRKSYYVGRVSGFEDDNVEDKEPGFTVITRMVDLLEDSLKNHHIQEVIKKRYLQATAALVKYPNLSNSHILLRSICWVPVRNFIPEMMKLATFSWEWLVVGAPYLVVSLIAEVVDTWIWTIQKNLGLFSGIKADANSLSLEERDDCAQSTSINGINSHNICLTFVLEQWEVACLSSSDILIAYAGIFKKLLNSSLISPSRLSHHPAAAGARFKLLALGLKICEFSSKRNPGNIPDLVLYERILRAGLAWFEYPPAWYGKWTRSEGDDEVAAVREFMIILAKWNHRQGLTASNTVRADEVLEHVWGKGVWNIERSEQRRELLLYLCEAEIQRLQVWAAPIPNIDPSASRFDKNCSKFVSTAWGVSPRLALGLADRFPSVSSVESELYSLISKNVTDPYVQSLPSAARILATCDVTLRLKVFNKFEALRYWAPCEASAALALLASENSKHSAVREYVAASLKRARAEELSFYLPQLVQALRSDSDLLLQNFLVEKALESWVFCHQLMWYLRSEFKPPPEAMNPQIKRSGWKPPYDTGLWIVTQNLYSRIVASLDSEAMQCMKDEMGYFDKLTEISALVKPYPKDQRRQKIEDLIKAINLPREDLYLPNNPDTRVCSVIPESGTPMPSKEKMPILVQFIVELKEENFRKEKRACIFKVGDDVRQDVLALQVIKILKDAFIKSGLDLYLYPYGVIPTDYERGIIEVVPDSKSRSALGETSDRGLYEIFQREFGVPGSTGFENARLEFMKSEAGYAIASYLLQCKDRHNGNILIDSQGHIIHIDFGFILEISPGGNMKFESADFKLSHEMTQLLDPGGMRNSHFFHMFKEMLIRAFLAARSVAEPIVTCVALMKQSGLPCFERGNAVKHIRKRFVLDQSEKQAAAHIQSILYNAYDKWTTAFYDKMQNYNY